VRPVLPLVNYAVNYDYIVKNLCEKKSIPQSTCKGKCYVEKELAKTEKQSNNSQTIKIAGLDAFIFNDIVSFNPIQGYLISSGKSISNSNSFHTSEYFSKIFHPPLV